MPPVIIELNPYFKGDSWAGLTIGPVIINGIQPVAQLVSCRMQFRTIKGVLGYELNTSPGAGEGTITITDPVTWEISVGEQVLDLLAKRYRWDFETTDAAGRVLTLYKGSFKVDGDVTHD